MKGFKLYACVTLFLLSNSLFAKWTPHLIARANMYGHGYQLPDYSTIANASPALNSEGDIAFKLTSVNGKAVPGIWLKRYDWEKGKLIFEGKSEEYISNPSLNMDANLVFHHFSEFESFGIKFYSAQTNTIKTLISPQTAPEIVAFSFPQLNDLGDVLFRALSEENKRSLVLIEKGERRTLVKEEGKISYIFTPAFNNTGNVAVKVRLGDGVSEDQPDQIRVYHSMGGYTLLNEDQNSSMNSTYSRFNNSTSLSPSNYLSYVATNIDGTREVVMQQGQRIFVIAKEGEGDIQTIEYFTPKATNFGEVAFRAIDKNGRRSIFVHRVNKTIKIISEGDHIDCDLEESCFVTFKKGFPGISGNVDINDWGEVAAHLLLSNKDMTDHLGSAIYLFKDR